MTSYTFTIGSTSTWRPMLLVTNYGVWLLTARNASTNDIYIAKLGGTNENTATATRSGSSVTVTFSNTQYGGIRVLDFNRWV